MTVRPLTADTTNQIVIISKDRISTIKMKCIIICSFKSDVIFHKMISNDDCQDDPNFWPEIKIIFFREAERKLHSLKEQRDNQRTRKQEMRQKTESISRSLTESRERLADIEHRLSRSKDDKESNTIDKDKVLHQKARVELELNDLKLSVSDDQNSKANALSEHENLRMKIFEKREELDQMKPEYERDGDIFLN